MKNTHKTPTIIYESIEAAILYHEFTMIPDNPFNFDSPENFIITVDFMIVMLKTSYYLKGWDYIDC